jgi:hypothetical protein
MMSVRASILGLVLLLSVVNLVLTLKLNSEINSLKEMQKIVEDQRSRHNMTLAHIQSFLMRQHSDYKPPNLDAMMKLKDRIGEITATAVKT